MNIFNHILASSSLRLLFLAFLWLLSEVIIFKIVKKNHTPASQRSLESKDKGSGWLLALGTTLLSATVLFTIYTKQPADLPVYFMPIGLTIMALGIGLRIWSVVTLGKFFTLQVKIFSHHQIIENGPYHWIRHPSYAGVLLTALGYGLASLHVTLLILFLIILGCTLAYRMHIEEKALKEKFGCQWHTYTHKTGLI